MSSKGVFLHGQEGGFSQRTVEGEDGYDLCCEGGLKHVEAFSAPDFSNLSPTGRQRGKSLNSVFRCDLSSRREKEIR